MALTRCPDCQQIMSDKAEHCPHCGYDNRSIWRMDGPVVKVGLIILSTIIGQNISS